MSEVSDKIILSLDGMELKQSLQLVSQVASRVYAIKVHDLVDYFGGPSVAHLLKGVGAPRVWVDYKFHDIPSTVGFRVSAMCQHDPDILTVHAQGGVEMMKVAMESAVIKRGLAKAEVFAVTLLTSQSEMDVLDVYGDNTTSNQVVERLALLAGKAGVHGVVCSAFDLEILSRLPELLNTKFIVPGVRSLGKGKDDQWRVDSPGRAVKEGATHVVVGKQVTRASDPLRAFREIEEEIAQALGE